MGFSKLTNYTIGNSGKFGSRNGAKLDRFIVHHGATVGWQNLKDTLSGSFREVSANYTIGNGETVGNVDEAYRAFTTGAASWDSRAVTVEVKNSTADPNWQVADNDFHALAKLIADVSIRYGFEINDNTVLTHQEINLRYGASYSTACPGDLQRRKPELLTLANQYRSGGSELFPDLSQAQANDILNAAVWV